MISIRAQLEKDILRLLPYQDLFLSNKTAKCFVNMTAGEAYYYALEVLEGRFEEGEEVIAKDPYWAYVYALYVLKGRFEEGEEAIAKDPKWAYYYALEVLKGKKVKGFKS